jgi:hypothetical protein
VATAYKVMLVLLASACFKAIDVVEVRAARKLIGWPKLCKLAHAFRWEYSCKRLRLARLLANFASFSLTGPAGPRLLPTTFYSRFASSLAPGGRGEVGKILC